MRIRKKLNQNLCDPTMVEVRMEKQQNKTKKDGK
jgi:hypothetical protein